MKFQKMIRVQLMLVGLGAGLLMAKPVFAQQDTDPTLFEATNVASQPDQVSFNVPPTSEGTIAATANPTVQPSVQETYAAALTAADVNMILTLMIGIGAIVLLGIAEVVRGSRRRTWKAEASEGLPSGAIAN
jgi:hypothetical protein